MFSGYMNTGEIYVGYSPEVIDISCKESTF
jgi:hypothetical protein